MSKKVSLLKSVYRDLRKNFKKIYHTVSGSKGYKKFIIITYARTGSNLLMSNLDSHGAIEAKGELFRDLKGMSCKEVWDNFYSKKNRRISYAGFKLFYTHPFHTNDKDVWKFIQEDKDIKIIHLIRNNKLRTYLSGEIAKKTDTWTKKSNKNISLEKKRIEIDFNDFIERVNRIKEFENNTRVKFKDHEFLEISYEELVSEKHTTMKKLFSFLDVEKRETKSGYKKQNTETLEDLILNYDEFIDKLAQTEFSYLIDLGN